MKKAALLLCTTLIAFLCGCKSGYSEINRGYLVTAIGFSTQNSATTIYIEALSSSDVEESASTRVVLTAVGPSAQDAFKNLQALLVKPLYFEQMGSAVFEPNSIKSGIEFLNNFPNINLGIYIVQTNNANALFNCKTPSGVLGYDIIGMIKSHNSKDYSYQLYKPLQSDAPLPTIYCNEDKMIFGDNI